MVMTPPTSDDLAMIAERYRLGLSQQDVEAFRVIIAGAMGSYDAVERLYAARLPEMPDRPHQRPAEAENELGAWYVTTEIKGADGGPLAGRRVAIKDNIAVAGVPMMNGSAIPGLRWPARIPEGAENSLARQRSPPGKPPRLGGRPAWFRWFATVTMHPGRVCGPLSRACPPARRVAGTHAYALRARRCQRPIRHTWHASPVPPQCGCRCRSGGRTSRARGGPPGRVMGP